MWQDTKVSDHAASKFTLKILPLTTRGHDPEYHEFLSATSLLQPQASYTDCHRIRSETSIWKLCLCSILHVLPQWNS